MLDVRRLRLLSELSRRGTIAEVARAVGYTPSAVSQSLARLERELGVALLERDGRRVALAVLTSGTEHGYGRETQAGIASRVLARAPLRNLPGTSQGAHSG
jgi:DNA-binding transcriptional ArsR family regulator